MPIVEKAQVRIDHAGIVRAEIQNAYELLLSAHTALGKAQPRVEVALERIEVALDDLRNAKASALNL